MISKLGIVLGVTLLFCLLAPPSLAAPPTGFVDIVDGVSIAGWARDPDVTGAIPIHVYVDNVIIHDQLASLFRQDVGSHAFHWLHAPFGAGEHAVSVYAIGVNAQGQADGENVLLGPTPTMFNVGCAGLTGHAFIWCRDNPAYWWNRQPDTKLLWNEYIKIGINTSYGGLINQLYNRDRAINLIEEHGGSAVQISVYGYDISNGPVVRWFGTGNPSRCDPVKYLTEQECRLHNSICSQREYATGAHVANCQTVLPCNQPNTDPGWPFNPIQAQAINCLWDHPSNDIDYSAAFGNGWETRLVDPYQYSKSNVFSGLTIGQQVTLGDVYAKIHYTLDYAGPYTTSLTGQELPAFFTNPELNRYYYYYGGTAYTNPASPVTRIVRNSSLKQFIKSPSYYYHQGDTSNLQAKEHWWGACDNSETKCITLATFNYRIHNFTINGGGVDESSYLAPIGYFRLIPGMHEEITLYVFPYKHDTLINGKTIRQRIFELAGANGAITPPPNPLQRFDIYRDRVIDANDLRKIIPEFGTTSSNFYYELNNRDPVDIFDYATILLHYGQTY